MGAKHGAQLRGLPMSCILVLSFRFCVFTSEAPSKLVSKHKGSKLSASPLSTVWKPRMCNMLHCHNPCLHLGKSPAAPTPSVTRKQPSRPWPRRSVCMITHTCKEALFARSCFLRKQGLGFSYKHFVIFTHVLENIQWLFPGS